MTEYKYDLFKDGLTKTAILTFMECKRLFYFRFIRGWSPAEESDSLIFGVLFHQCAEFWYKNKDSKDNIVLEHVADTILENYEGENDAETWGLARRQQWEIIKAKLTAVFPAYVHWYAKEDATFVWREIETVFQTPIRVKAHGKEYEVIITGKMDRVFNRTKRNGVLDIKTKGFINLGGITNTLLYDFQMNLYAWAANKLYGAKYDHIIYDIVHNPSLRLSQKETVDAYCERIKKDIGKNPADYFIRVEQKMQAAHLAKFEPVLKKTVAEIVEFYLDGKNSEDFFTPSCLGPYGQCELLEICYRGDAAKLKKREFVHPELHE